MACEPTAEDSNTRNSKIIWRNHAVDEADVLQWYNKINLRERTPHGITEEALPLHLLTQHSNQRPSDKSYHVCVTGTDGSGRSVVLAELTHNVVTKESMSFFHGVEIIVSLNCGMPDVKKAADVGDLIFGGIGNTSIKYQQSETDMPDPIASRIEALQWMEHNAPKLCFVFDDIDRMILGATGDKYRVYRDTLTDILSGNKFTGCIILSSCHEDNIASMLKATNTSVTRLFHTFGLTAQAVQKVASSFLGGYFYENNFVKMTPYSMALCENPLILNYTLHGIIGNENNLHDGMAGIFLNLLCEIKKRNAISDVRKMMTACYEARKSGAATPTTADLEMIKLNDSDTSRQKLLPLFITKTIGTGERIKREFRHPIILDGFTALYLYNYGKTGSEEYYETVIQGSRFFGAWKILSGLVSIERNKEIIFDLIAQDPERKKELMIEHDNKKRTILEISRRYIRCGLEAEKDADDQLRAMHLLAECAIEDGVGEEFKTFTLKPQKLNRADSIALAACICSRVEMKQLNLDYCDLSSDFLSVLEQHIAACKEKVKITSASFTQREGRTPTAVDLESLGNLLKYVSEFCDLSGWNFGLMDVSIMQVAVDKINNPKLKVRVKDGTILTSRGNRNGHNDPITFDAKAVKSVPRRKDTFSIGREEKKIEVGGCKVCFPAGTFAGVQPVTLTTEIDAEKWPPGKEAVTPTIFINAKNLQKPATLELPTWCSLEDDSEGIDLMLFNEGLNKWKVISPAAVRNGAALEFQSQEDGQYVGTLRAEQSLTAIYLVRPIVCFRNANFVVALIRDTELDRTNLMDYMKNDFGDGFRTKHFCPLPCTMTQTFDSCIKCVNPSQGFEFVATGSFSHGIQNIIKYSIPSYGLCQLRGNDSKMNVTLQFELSEGGKPLRTADCFRYCWEPGEGVEKKEEQIEEAFEDVSSRFTDTREFREFAISPKGFSVTATQLVQVMDDHTEDYEQRAAMLQIWCREEGNDATAKKLRELVDDYFSEQQNLLNQSVGKNEIAAEGGTAHEERIDDVFDSEISSRFIDSQEFYKFARASSGFCIDQSDQQRIELDYSKESDRRVMMFRHWRTRQGKNYTAMQLRKLVDQYFNEQ